MPSGRRTWLMSALLRSNNCADLRLLPESPEYAMWCSGEALAKPPFPPCTSARSSSSLPSTSQGAPSAAMLWMGQLCAKSFPWKLTPARYWTRSSTAASVRHRFKGGATLTLERWRSARSSRRVSSIWRSWLLNQRAKCKGERSAMYNTSGMAGALVWMEALMVARLRTSRWSPESTAQATGPRPCCFKGFLKEKSLRKPSTVRHFAGRPVTSSNSAKYNRKAVLFLLWLSSNTCRVKADRITCRQQARSSSTAKLPECTGYRYHKDVVNWADSWLFTTRIGIFLGRMDKKWLHNSVRHQPRSRKLLNEHSDLVSWCIALGTNATKRLHMST